MWGVTRSLHPPTHTPLITCHLDATPGMQLCLEETRPEARSRLKRCGTVIVILGTSVVRRQRPATLRSAGIVEGSIGFSWDLCVLLPICCFGPYK